LILDVIIDGVALTRSHARAFGTRFRLYSGQLVQGPPRNLCREGSRAQEGLATSVPRWEAGGCEARARESRREGTQDPVRECARASSGGSPRTNTRDRENTSDRRGAKSSKNSPLVGAVWGPARSCFSGDGICSPTAAHRLPRPYRRLPSISRRTGSMPPSWWLRNKRAKRARKNSGEVPKSAPVIRNRGRSINRTRRGGLIPAPARRRADASSQIRVAKSDASRRDGRGRVVRF